MAPLSIESPYSVVGTVIRLSRQPRRNMGRGAAYQVLRAIEPLTRVPSWLFDVRRPSVPGTVFSMANEPVSDAA